ncbi:TPA: hypothetical protein ACOJPH_002341 [Vibrio campbellii]|uniref:hypothetical protein n=1 Tax=Vibrio campbellii TaxID=680 RepID=UPI003908F85E
MRFSIIARVVLFSCVSLSASAATVKVKWVGVVPSLDCASRPITNQTDFDTLNQQCQSEFKIETQHLNKQTKVNKSIVSFDV